jgi:hypothetical protein
MRKKPPPPTSSALDGIGESHTATPFVTPTEPAIGET